MDQQQKPLPQPTKYSHPYWEATHRHELILQCCLDCQSYRHYPRPRCPKCLSRNYQWVKAKGIGKIYSFTVVYRPLTRAFLQEIPYIFAIVELAEGVRMVSTIVDCNPHQVYIGMPVEVVFTDITPEVTLPRYRPITSQID